MMAERDWYFVLPSEDARIEGGDVRFVFHDESPRPVFLMESLNRAIEFARGMAKWVTPPIWVFRARFDVERMDDWFAAHDSGVRTNSDDGQVINAGVLKRFLRDAAVRPVKAGEA